MHPTIAMKTRCILQRTFVSGVSFEIPHPAYSLMPNVTPALDMQLHVYEKKSGLPDTYQVELRILTEVSLVQNEQNDKKVLFLLEITQGGLFSIPNPKETSLEEILHVDCPESLYPYARELISSLITRAEFTPFYLPPVDFHSKYFKHKQERKA